MADHGITLIVGLGNPGPEYAETRHNAGFRFLDALLAGTGEQLRHEAKFGGDVVKISLAGRPVWLLAPMEFMNHSGRTVSRFAQFYKILSSQMLIVHDELDLSPGVVRLKVGGGTGGHNGLTDVVEKLGTPDFARLRIGIGHPGTAAQVSGYVLRKAPAPEQAMIDEAIERARDHIEVIVQGQFEKAMNALHTPSRAGD